MFLSAEEVKIQPPLLLRKSPIQEFLDFLLKEVIFSSIKEIDRIDIGSSFHFLSKTIANRKVSISI
jgi:hypothetical protein